jgi:hypothetical protein
MKTLDIARLVIDTTSGLLVYPNMDGRASYEYIYREANGLRWSDEKQALHAYEPTRWNPEELLSHMASTLSSNYDEELRFTEQTEWQGVSSELRSRLLHTLTHNQNHEKEQSGSPASDA